MDVNSQSIQEAIDDVVDESLLLENMGISREEIKKAPTLRTMEEINTYCDAVTNQPQ